MSPLRVVLTVFVACSACLQAVPECPEGGCLQPASTLSLTEACTRQRNGFWCETPKRCGLADPMASCEAINKNVTSAPDELCWYEEQQALDAGRLQYDPKAAAECVAALEQLPCFSSSAPAACERVFTGLQPLGSTCFSGAECVSGAWCDRSASCPGRCVALADAGVVVPDALGCARGLAAAEQQDGGWRCVAPVPSGAVCRQPREQLLGAACQSPTDACSFPFDGGVGRCEPFRSQLGARGAACDLSQRCQRGLACRFVPGETLGRCQNLIPLGQSCQLDFNGCEVGAMCGRALTCVPEPRAGEACTATCVKGTRCEAGVCQPVGQLGGACPCAYGLRCVENRCEPQRCN